MSGLSARIKMNQGTTKDLQIKGPKKTVMLQMSRKRMTKCKYCRKKVSNGIEETDNKETCLKCPVCESTSKSYGGFIMHQRKHTTLGENPFQCSICPKSFSLSGNLRKHVKNHKNK